MKTIIVTGSNSGIGKEAALNLANSGHRVLMLRRDSEKLEKPHKGGERIAYLASSDAVKETTGRYFYKLEEREIDISAQETGKTEKLWQVAQELTGLGA